MPTLVKRSAQQLPSPRFCLALPDLHRFRFSFSFFIFGYHRRRKNSKTDAYGDHSRVNYRICQES
jgi:hypothetical protein